MDQHDEDQVVAASEQGPTTYTQSLGDGEPTGEEVAMSEEGPQVYGLDGTVKVIRPGHRDGPSHTTDAQTKDEHPGQHRRR